MIYSYVTKRIEDGGWTGVCRFDHYLRRVFPGIRSVTPEMRDDVTFLPRDVVITDNHLSNDIPNNVPTIVVHHGCAQTHYDRDVSWRNERTLAWCEQQRKMFTIPNRLYVAPSEWVRREFAEQYGLPADYARVIVNWVPIIDTVAPTDCMRKLRVIGDWRDSNKGHGVWQQLAAELPDVDFAPCDFRTDWEREEFYQQADVYLCLSLSEGGSYSVADAEAAALPIVTTPTGNCYEFDAVLIPTECRDHAPSVSGALIEAVEREGCGPFYDGYSFERWAELWRQAVAEVVDGSPAYL